MKEPSLLQKIFSITNVPKKKIIYFFGLKFEFDITKIFKAKYGKLPIDKNKIVFIQTSCKGFGCNPKYIAKEIIRQKLPYELVWLLTDTRDEDVLKEFPPEIKIVKYKSQKALKELATAKLWVANKKQYYFLLNKGLDKKQGQKYIQTWHGALGIKRTGMDSDELVKEYYEPTKKDSQMTDYMISNSEFENKIMQSAFEYDKQLVKFGHPRNDILINANADDIAKIRQKLELADDVKVALYAPTFRDDGRLYCFGLEYENLIQTLEEKFGGKWVLFIRLHPAVASYSKQLIPTENNIMDVSNYPDIQELMLISDILITDYSSCAYDFILTRRPAFIYANDIKEYNNERGFYYPLEETPFPIAKTNYELINNIKNFNYENYKPKVEEFLQSKGCIDDGKASFRVVELIKKIIASKD